MTYRIGDVVVVEPEADEVCELCGAVEETRPYGPRGERICFDCMKKNEPAAKRQFGRLLGEDVQ